MFTYNTLSTLSCGDAPLTLHGGAVYYIFTQSSRWQSQDVLSSLMSCENHLVAFLSVPHQKDTTQPKEQRIFQKINNDILYWSPREKFLFGQLQ